MIYTVNIGDSSRRLWKRGYSRLVWIKIGGETVELTRVENEILLVLANNLNQPISIEKNLQKYLEKRRTELNKQCFANAYQ